MADIFQLAHIPRPIQTAEIVFRFRKQPFAFLIQQVTRLLEVVPQQQGNVLPPLPQGRQAKADDV
jgi:hypothetical protein